MPLVESSTFKPRILRGNGHVQTILSSILRRVPTVQYERERILTYDKDFIDLDWAKVGSEKLAIISHGLEGSSQSSYVRGIVRALNRSGWDALAWNFRGCSGEPNRLLISYHSGKSDDLQTVFSHALFKKEYAEIALIGFSLGGNVTLKFLGEQGESVAPLISKAIALSVPCDLASAADVLRRRSRKLYMKHFLKRLHDKVRAKMELFPGQIDDKDFGTIGSFHEFDSRYTAPIHGFKDVHEYWSTCSSKRFLRDIKVDSLIINAVNDPFLSNGCFPVEEAKGNSALFLEMPVSGGHVGFLGRNDNGMTWAENRCVEFLAA